MILKSNFWLAVFFLFFPLWQNVCFSTEVGTLRLKSGVVKIYAKGEHNPVKGSGFIIKYQKKIAIILTAHHVVKKDENPQVEFFAYNGGRTHLKFSARRIAVDQDNDIALLKIEHQENMPDADNLYVFPFSSWTLKERDEVEIIGIPGTIDNWVISDGKIIQIGTKIAFTGFFETGNSGGPLVKDDRVVGLIYESCSAVCGYARPVSIIKLFLHDQGIRLE